VNDLHKILEGGPGSYTDLVIGGVNGSIQELVQINKCFNLGIPFGY